MEWFRPASLIIWAARVSAPGVSPHKSGHKLTGQPLLGLEYMGGAGVDHLVTPSLPSWAAFSHSAAGALQWQLSDHIFTVVFVLHNAWINTSWLNPCPVLVYSLLVFLQAREKEMKQAFVKANQYCLWSESWYHKIISFELNYYVWSNRSYLELLLSVPLANSKETSSSRWSLGNKHHSRLPSNLSLC